MAVIGECTAIEVELLYQKVLPEATHHWTTKMK